MGGYMEEKDTYNTGTLFFMGNDGICHPLSKTEEMSIEDDNCSPNSDDGTIIRHFNSDPVTINVESCYINQKIIYKLLHGISNNYLRMHGGKALREHTKYNWYKRCKKK